MMGNFPSLDEAAWIFNTGAHENRRLERKILRKRTENCLRNTRIPPFRPKYTVFAGFREIAFAWDTTHENRPFRPSNYRFVFLLDMARFYLPHLLTALLKRKKSSYLVWTRCAITAQNIAIPRR